MISFGTKIKQNVYVVVLKVHKLVYNGLYSKHYILYLDGFMGHNQRYGFIGY